MAEESERKSAKQLLSRGKKAAGRRAGRRWSLFSSTTTMAPGSSTVSAAGPAPLISRSYSTTDVIEQVVTKQPQAAPGGGVGARLSRKVKEQRARLYIARRCVSMLVCWRDADDS